MPVPEAHPEYPALMRVGKRTLAAGVLIMAMKIAAYFVTGSVAVLSDALESIINLVAGGMMLLTLSYSNRPADRDHPYGHGKIDFMAAGLEGWMILVAGLVIVVTAVQRLLGDVALERIDAGMIVLAVTAVLNGTIGVWVYRWGKRHDIVTLRAHGKHLMTDVASTVAVIGGLYLVKVTDRAWIDPLLAVLIAGFIFWTSWRLLWESIDGLMDRSDPDDRHAIESVLDEEIAAGEIDGYHKVRVRHSGAFHWIDMHLQVDAQMSVRQSHELASRIEHRVENLFPQGNATAHVEPHKDAFGQAHVRSNASDSDEGTDDVAASDEADGDDVPAGEPASEPASESHDEASPDARDDEDHASPADDGNAIGEPSTYELAEHPPELHEPETGSSSDDDRSEHDPPSGPVRREQ